MLKKKLTINIAKSKLMISPNQMGGEIIGMAVPTNTAKMKIKRA